MHVSDLVVFLYAQLDEDERLAKEAGELVQGHGVAAWSVPCWVDCARADGDDTDYDHAECRCCRVEGDNITVYDEGGHDRSQALHIARWDPVRVLAELKSQRQIVEDCARAINTQSTPPQVDHVDSGTPYVSPHANLAYRTLCSLALVYADRPGYLGPGWPPVKSTRPDRGQ